MTFGGPIGRAAYGAFLERGEDQKAAVDYYEILSREPGPARKSALKGLDRLENGDTSRLYANPMPTEGAAIAFFTLGATLLEESINQRNAAQEAGYQVGDINYDLPLVFAQIALNLDPTLDDARRFAGTIMNIYGDHERSIEMFLARAAGLRHFMSRRRLT